MKWFSVVQGSGDEGSGDEGSGDEGSGDKGRIECRRPRTSYTHAH